jgi:hypothetical protein
VIREITLPPVGAHVFGKWQRNLAIYAIALMSSATVVGAIIGTLGIMLGITEYSHVWIAVIATIAFLYGLRELSLIRLPMPQINWQVPAHWAGYGKATQALLYGAVLGTEVLTLIPYATFYLLVLLELSGGVITGALLGFSYGLVRALSMIASVTVARMRRLDANKLAMKIWHVMPDFHTANGVALIMMSGLLLAAAIVVQ